MAKKSRRALAARIVASGPEVCHVWVERPAGGHLLLEVVAHGPENGDASEWATHVTIRQAASDATLVKAMMLAAEAFMDWKLAQP